MSQHCTWRWASVGRDWAADLTLVTVYWLQPPSCPSLQLPGGQHAGGRQQGPVLHRGDNVEMVSTGECLRVEARAQSAGLRRGHGCGARPPPAKVTPLSHPGPGPVSSAQLGDGALQVHYIVIACISFLSPQILWSTKKIHVPNRELFRGPFKHRNFFWLRPASCLGWAGGEELCNLRQPIGGRGASLGPPPPIRSGVAGLETRAMRRRGIRISGCAPPRDVSHL